ncbi:hypothetical protein [Rhodococcus sp. 1168]|nr:hypothetical protein [Rhodococcus sp. 1168]
MGDTTQVKGNRDDNLLNQLDSLDVVEAAELQDGAAFHAFRFAV